MEFGSEYVYVPTTESTREEEEYEEIPETKYNHVVTGYSSRSSANSSLPDDGEVKTLIH